MTNIKQLMFSKTLTRGMSLFAFAFYSCMAMASEVTLVATEDSSISFDQGTSHDLLQVNPPNESGISVNRFERFYVDEPLKIVNLPGKDADGIEKSAAHTVLIVAPDIDILSSVELLGSASDVVFISSSDNDYVACDPCSFDNFFRVTIATVPAGFHAPSDLSQIGNLTTSTGSKVALGGVSASGILSFEVLTRILMPSVSIETRETVSSSSFGGFEHNVNGDKKVGGSGANIIIGDIEWRYESQSLVSVGSNGLSQSLSGTINASSINIFNSNSLNVSATLNTRSDLISTMRYKGMTHISPETVTLQSFKDDLVFSGQIKSNGRVNIRSGEDALTTESGVIEASDIDLIARNDALILGSVTADRLGIAADFVLNRGRIEGFEKVELYSENNIVNNFGGMILSEVVALESKSGVIRNGSRQPYASANHSYAQSLNYSPNDASDNGFATGLFYHSDVYEEDLSARVRPSSLAAGVIGGNISLKAPVVENLNPYWVATNEDGTADVNSKLLGQVGIIANNMLKVSAESYLLNSSAMMRVDNPLGTMSIRSPIVSNERYRTLNLLDKDTSVETVTEQGSSTEVTTTSFYTRPYSFSPPGLIVSMGSLEMEANSSFVNKQAYFEVYGDAWLNSPSIKVVGIENDGILGLDTVHYYEECFGSFWSHAYGYPIGRCSVEEGRVINVSGATEGDSLFFVHGNLHGSDAWFQASLFNPFDQYVQIVVDAILGRDFSGYAEDGHVESEVIGSVCPTSFDFGLGGTCTVITSTSSDSLHDGDDLTVWASRHTEYVHTNYGYSSTSMEWTVSDENTYSLIDELLLLWDQLVEWFSSLLSDLNWWSEE
ncbi:MAG: hypothetical protein MK096_00650 [Oleiphilaceae bacterium]|nr:hypothetical protein [Oleiphilaceae bacterium]